ncbi:MAG: LPP20 family lipoprotein [Desulfobacterales bacterium]|nr:LPP20 family lipoprotein [Desulfobacterales bacterium]
MKKCSLIILLILSLGFFANGNAAGQDVEERLQNGSINWTTGKVQAKGIGAPPEKDYGKPQARPMALRAARIDALRNILEIVNGVRIDSSTTVKNFAIQSDVINAKVSGMVQGAELVKQEYMSDGTVEIVMQLSLHGGFSQLILPREIKQIEPIKPAVNPSASDAKEQMKAFTGLVVDARGLNARPAMAPKILDEDGKEVYGSAYVSREFAVQQGMTGYAKDIKAAITNQRVADNPLTVKGLKTEGGGFSNIVVSNSDAARLRSASEHLSFLKKCRVMVVVD